jgi:hypothetical protein
MRGGVTPDDDNEDTPFNAAEVSVIIPPEGEEEHDLIDDDDDGNVFQDEEQSVLGYNSLDDSGSLHMSDLENPTRELSGETTRDTGLSVSNPRLSMSSFSMVEPEGEENEEENEGEENEQENEEENEEENEQENEQEGGKRKRRKGKKTQKRRRGKKGGENPPTFNSYIDKVADPDHD